MEVRIDPRWRELLQTEFDKPYFEQLTAFVRNEYAHCEIFPRGGNIFRAFNLCPPDNIKAVIIGQDPYHGDGQADGLCFSVADGVSFPPSLQNIFTEIKNELGVPVPQSGRLDRWAEQGVLLLNSVLTVRAHQAASHSSKGWEQFTDAVIDIISHRYNHIVYMLWGSYAQRKGQLVDPSENCILKSVHPSPLSAYRGFLGCGHFAAANEYLKSVGRQPIEW